MSSGENEVEYEDTAGASEAGGLAVDWTAPSEDPATSMPENMAFNTVPRMPENGPNMAFNTNTGLPQYMVLNTIPGQPENIAFNTSTGLPEYIAVDTIPGQPENMAFNTNTGLPEYTAVNTNPGLPENMGFGTSPGLAINMPCIIMPAEGLNQAQDPWQIMVLQRGEVEQQRQKLQNMLIKQMLRNIQLQQHYQRAEQQAMLLKRRVAQLERQLGIWENSNPEE